MGIELDQGAVKNTDPRTCTCHPDDNPPDPCPRKFALTDCRIAELLAATEAIDSYFDDGRMSDKQMTGARITFGEMRRIGRARAALARWR